MHSLAVCEFWRYGLDISKVFGIEQDVYGRQYLIFVVKKLFFFLDMTVVMKRPEKKCLPQCALLLLDFLILLIFLQTSKSHEIYFSGFLWLNLYMIFWGNLQNKVRLVKIRETAFILVLLFSKLYLWLCFSFLPNYENSWGLPLILRVRVSPTKEYLYVAFAEVS